MSAAHTQASIANMSDTQFNELLSALGRAREHARLLMLEGRLPERAAFGAIALDLDYSFSILGHAMPPSSAISTDVQQIVPT